MKKAPHSTRDSLISQACLWLYVAVLAGFFMTDSITAFYFSGHPFVSTNVSHFRDDAVCLAQGNLPYGDEFARCVAGPRKTQPDQVTFEYPPLAAVMLYGLGKAAPGKDAFQMAFVGTMLGLFCVCFLIVFNEADALRRAGGPDRRAAVTAAAAAATLAAGPVAMVSFDILPAALCLGAFVLLMRNKTALPAVLLALSALAKGYAIVLIPLFIFIWLRNGGLRRAAAGTAVFSAVIAAVAAAAMFISPSGFIKSFTYHSGRGLELNSLYAALLVPFKNHGLKFEGVFNHGSFNLVGGGPWVDILSKISPALMLISITLVTLIAWRRSSKTAAAESPNPGSALYTAGVRWTVAVLLAFIVTFKVGSPQFLCWVAPFLPLLLLQSGGLAPLLLFIAAGHASTWVYPWMWYTYATNLRPLPAFALLFEKLCLAAMIVILFKPSHPKSEPRA